MRKLPIGIQSFETLRENDYLYVDKTDFIRELTESGKAYFLSRPRRFGKSLLLSTLEAYFQGKKELFHGLSIEKAEEQKGEKAWQKYPVILFSLSGGEYNTAGGLAETLKIVLSRTEIRYDLKPEGNIVFSDLDLSNRFRLIIEGLYRKTGQQVVILVDEYDKPLLETMEINEDQEEKNRQLYKGFFSVLKDEDRFLKFVFFTGVTKFSKVSIFSDLNQLNDISLDDKYSGICGITEEELLSSFQPEIESMAKRQGQTREDCIRKLAGMYDGYHFSVAGPGVYNPFSILNAFSKQDYGRYWFSTGTPTFLIHKLQHSDFNLEQLVDGVEVSEMELTDYRTNNPNPIPLFYQSGYLTICGYDREFRIYSLRFPNQEVEYGFLNSLVPSVLGNINAENPISVRDMILDLRNGKIESFMQRLKSLFASVPYPEGKAPEYEQEWERQIYLVLKLLGQNVQCEVHSAKGRADCIVETKDYVYIFEFKLDKSSDEALRQIKEKGYAEPYKPDKRRMFMIGVNFSSEERNISEWKIE